MIDNKLPLAMDTEDDREISVSISRDLVVLADTTQIPYRRIYLTATEARKLAEMLIEQAALTDDAAPVHVPMVCTKCRTPVTRNLDDDWQHGTTGEAMACPTQDWNVKAMVAAGNENVPADA